MRSLALLSFLIFTLTPALFWSQEIKVIDANTGDPIEGVALYNTQKTKSVLTDTFGAASLRDFSREDNVNVQFYGYVSQVLSPEEWGKDTKLILPLMPEEQSLEEVILSVARNPTSRKQIAEKVAVISKKEIELQRPTTGADLVSLSPGIRIQESQGGGGSPVIRGFEANRILLVVDGVRMNNAIYRSGHLQNAITVNPNIIERVEIVYGSSSVGYGSDALGGVILYYTKSPRLNSDQKITTSLSSDYSSARNSFINSLTAEVSFKKWGSLTNVSYSDFGDIRIGKYRPHGFEDWGLTPFYSTNTRTEYNPNPVVNPDPTVQKNTGYKQVDVFQKWLYQIDAKNEFVLNLQYSNSSDIFRYDMLVQEKNGSLRFAEWYYGPQKRFMLAPQLKLFPEKKFMHSGVITAAYQKIEESRNNRTFNSLTRNRYIEKVNLWSLNADFEFELENNHSFSYGVEATNNDVRSYAYQNDLILNGNSVVGLTPSLPIPTRYPSRGSGYMSFAGFVNWVWSVNEQLTLNLGARVTTTSLEARWKEYYNINALLSNVRLYTKALTSTLAITYRPSNKTQWNVIVSDGFRNPNIDDIGKIRENKGVLIVPNPNLFPEYAYNFELGLTRYLKESKNYLDFRGFTTLISRHIGRDFYTIFADKTTPDLSTILYNGSEVITMSNNNMGNRFLVGASAEGKLELLETLQLQGNLSYINALKNDKYGPLPSISPIFGSVLLHYSKDQWFSQLRFQFSGSKDPSQYSFGGEDGLEETPLLVEELDQYAGTPGWNTFSWMAQYNWNEQIRFRFALDNIFDQHYRTFASGISAPGRNLSLGVHLQF